MERIKLHRDLLKALGESDVYKNWVSEVLPTLNAEEIEFIKVTSNEASFALYFNRQKVYKGDLVLDENIEKLLGDYEKNTNILADNPYQVSIVPTTDVVVLLKTLTVKQDSEAKVKKIIYIYRK